jgi:hypothetical protein
VQTLIDTLEGKNTQLQDAVKGLSLLDDLRVDGEAKEKYSEAARKQFPEATVFAAR